MARQHFSTKDFFRHVPNALLARYFHKEGLFTDLDFKEMKETKIDALFNAWLELGEEQRNPMDAKFREVFELSNPKGFSAIIDEARWQLRTTPEEIPPFIEKLSALPGHYHRAMTTFLEYPDCWKGAIRFYHADTLAHWRKRKNLGSKPATVDDTTLQQFARLIGNYFHLTEGRGKNCEVEPYRRGELDYFFCFPEDHSQQSSEWVKGVFGNRPHNPAFEVVFVYSQNDGTLDLNFKGSYKAVEPLQNMFTSTILKLNELPPDPKDQRVYDLSPLSQKDFDFTFTPGSGIEDVVVKKMRLSSRFNKGEKITLEADTSNNPKAIYDLMDKIRKATPIHQYNVTQVVLSASMIVAADKPAKPVTIRITHPNSCSLKYDERDLKLRAMLEASGIEPKEPEEKKEATPTRTVKTAEVRHDSPQPSA